MRINSEATYDCIFLGSGLQQQVGGFAAAELHLLSYLACLLSLYDRNLVTDWGYSFVGTEFGAPFSQEIDDAINELIGRGNFLQIKGRFQVTERAAHYVQELGQLTINQIRTKCLLAAFASTAVFSIGMVSSAMSQEPDLRRAQTTPANRFLLEEPATSQLYQQFDVLRKAISQQSNDLRLPAVVWLEALYRASERIQER